MSGGFIGACVGDSHPLVVGGGLWGAFRASGMSCMPDAGHP